MNALATGKCWHHYNGLVQHHVPGGVHAGWNNRFGVLYGIASSLSFTEGANLMHRQTNSKILGLYYQASTYKPSTNLSTMDDLKYFFDKVNAQRLKSAMPAATIAEFVDFVQENDRDGTLCTNTRTGQIERWSDGQIIEHIAKNI